MSPIRSLMEALTRQTLSTIQLMTEFMQASVGEPGIAWGSGGPRLQPADLVEPGSLTTPRRLTNTPLTNVQISCERLAPSSRQWMIELWSRLLESMPSVWFVPRRRQRRLLVPGRADDVGRCGGTRPSSSSGSGLGAAIVCGSDPTFSSTRSQPGLRLARLLRVITTARSRPNLGHDHCTMLLILHRYACLLPRQANARLAPVIGRSVPFSSALLAPGCPLAIHGFGMRLPGNVGQRPPDRWRSAVTAFVLSANSYRAKVRRARLLSRSVSDETERRGR